MANKSSKFIENDERYYCDQCSAATINGVACHETGCPNKSAIWDAIEERWIHYVKCFECGGLVESGEICDCQEPFYDPTEEEWADLAAN